MAKYIVNKTNMAYEFQNKVKVGRKGTIEVNEKQEAELRKDFFFKGLLERGAVALSNEKPKDLSEAGLKLASKDAELKSLQKRIKELEAKLDAAGATGKETNLVLDPETPAEPTVNSENSNESGENAAENEGSSRRGKK